MSNKDISLRADTLVDHLFRHEYGKMVSVLVRIFGTENIALCEDVVQETFIKALSTWRFGEIPEIPAAWLHKVARNKAIDKIRSKNSRLTRSKKFIGLNNELEEINDLFLDGEIADSQLRLIFSCCQLDLNEREKIAITLKLVSGFGLAEIAKALQQKIETVKKRIHRARKKLQEQNKPISIPSGIALRSSQDTVLKIIYLIFNEGYNSSKQDQIIRKDLCAEAMRLCKIVIDHPLVSSTDASALMAMMCYHSARLDSRMNDNQELILIKYQDRNKWYKPLINIGHSYFQKSLETEKKSIYHLEAAIAAQHCQAKDFESTDFKALLFLYKLLYEVKPTPMVKLNLVVVHNLLDEVTTAWKLLKEMNEEMFMPNPYLYHAVASKVCYNKNNYLLAKKHLEKSLETVDTDAERKLLLKRLEEFE